MPDCHTPAPYRRARYPRASIFVVRSTARSMVINCLPTAKRRGEMLAGYRDHLRPGGHLFLMLPLLCLTKSTRTTRASFAETLKKIGFRIRETRESPKVAFFCATTAPLKAGMFLGTELESSRDGDATGARGRGGASLPVGERAGEANGSAKRRSHHGRGGNDFAVTL